MTATFSKKNGERNKAKHTARRRIVGQGEPGDFFEETSPLMKEGKSREAAFCAKSRFPNPPAKTLGG